MPRPFSTRSALCAALLLVASCLLAATLVHAEQPAGLHVPKAKKLQERYYNNHYANGPPPGWHREPNHVNRPGFHRPEPVRHFNRPPPARYSYYHANNRPVRGAGPDRARMQHQPHYYRPGMHRFVSPFDAPRTSPAGRHQSHLVNLPPEFRVGREGVSSNNNPANVDHEDASPNVAAATAAGPAEPAAPAPASSAGSSSASRAFALSADRALADKAASASRNSLGRGPGFSLKEFEKLHSYYGALEIYTVPASGPASDSRSVPTSGSAAAAAAAAQDLHPAERMVNAAATGNSTAETIANSIPNPAELLTSINWGSSVVAIVLIVFGVLMAFAGFALFKIILFVAGFYSFSLLTVFVLDLVQANLQGDQLTSFNNNSAIIFGVCIIIMGIIGGALFLCLWRLGLFFIGGLLGYTLATFILTVTGSSFIPSTTWRYVFIGAIALVFAIAILFIEIPLLILSTAISGAFALVVGIDVFVQTGFVAAVTGVANNVSTNGSSALESGVAGVFSGSTMVMSIVFCVVAVLGIVIQWVVSSRDHGKGRFSHATVKKERDAPVFKGWGYRRAVPVEKV